MRAASSDGAETLSRSEQRTPRFARLLARLGNPQDWHAADKCTLAALFILPFVTWYLAWAYYFWRHSDVTPYLDRDGLVVTIQVLWFLLISWLAVLLAARLLRRRRSLDWLMHAAVQLYAVGFGVFSYLTGHYSSGYASSVSLSGAAAGLIVFGQRPILLGAVSFLAVLVGTSVAEQLRWIPYAPLLGGAPWQNGQLSGWWVLGFGGLPQVIALVGFFLIAYVVQRWRARENELARMADQLGRANDLISRYVAAQVAEQIRAGNFDAVDRHERRKLTVFFSDIKGFTEIADQIEAEDLSRILNEYLAEMAEIAERYGGTIDKFIGDAIMILFGAPVATDDRDHALRAVRMAIEMQARMSDLRARWLSQGIEEGFEIRIGINSGVASVGNFGAKGRIDYTAIGRQVNLAARLQVNCEPGRVLLSHATWGLVGNEIPCVQKGEIQVKGIHYPVRVYEVVTMQPSGTTPLVSPEPR